MKQYAIHDIHQPYAIYNIPAVEAVIGKMFGLCHPPAPKILFKYSGNFGVEGRVSLK